MRVYKCASTNARLLRSRDGWGDVYVFYKCMTSPKSAGCVIVPMLQHHTVEPGTLGLLKDFMAIPELNILMATNF